MLVTLIIGLSIGSIYGLTALGLVLTFRTSGVLNLAHGAMGMAGALLFQRLWIDAGLPLFPALGVSLVFAAALGGGAYLMIFRWIQGKATAITLFAAVAALLAVQTLATVVFGVKGSELFPSLFPFHVFEVTDGFNVTSEQLGTMTITLALGALLVWYLHRTRLGLVVRAVVDNPELAATNGTNVQHVYLTSWALASMLAATSAILIAPFLSLDVNLLTLVVIQAMAAAVVGGLRSLPLTYVGGLGLGVLESFLGRYLPSSDVFQGLKVSAAFVVLYTVIVLGTRFYRNLEQVTGRVAVELLGREAPPHALLPIVVGYVAVAVAMPFVSSFMLLLITAGVIASIAFLGLVLVTGLGGQVVLCQGAFVGIGALLFARLVGDTGLPFLLAALVAIAAAGAASLAISLPAIRLRGLPLALLTLAFALFMDVFVFRIEAIFGGFSGFTIARPEIGFLDLADDRVFGYVALVLAGGAALLVRNLSAGRSGRVLAAMKSSEVAVEAFGGSVRDAKLLLFMGAALLGALAGVLTSLHLQSVAPTQFSVFLSLTFLVLAVLSGVANAQGALLGGLLLHLGPEFIQDAGIARYQQALFGVGATVVLVARRGGLADMLSRPLLGFRSLLGRTPGIAPLAPVLRRATPEPPAPGLTNRRAAAARREPAKGTPDRRRPLALRR